MSTVVCAWEMSDRWGAIVEIFLHAIKSSSRGDGSVFNRPRGLLSARLIIAQNTFQK